MCDLKLSEHMNLDSFQASPSRWSVAALSSQILSLSGRVTLPRPLTWQHRRWNTIRKTPKDSFAAPRSDLENRSARNISFPFLSFLSLGFLRWCLFCYLYSTGLLCVHVRVGYAFIFLTSDCLYMRLSLLFSLSLWL